MISFSSIVSNARAGEALWILIDQLGGFILSLFSIKILTTILDLAEYGRLALAVTIVSLVSNAIFGPLGQSLMRFSSIAREQNELSLFYLTAKRYERYAFGLIILFSAIGGCVLYLFGKRDWIPLMLASSNFGAISGLLAIRTSIFTAFRMRRLVAVIHNVGLMLRTLISALFLLIIDKNANMVMMGYLLATILVVIGAEKFYRRLISETRSSSAAGPKEIINKRGCIRRDVLSLALLFFLWSIFSWVKSSSDRWALSSFFGLELVGGFAIILQISNYLIMLGSNFLTTLFNPIAFQHAGNFGNARSVKYANSLLVRMVYIYVSGVLALIFLFTLIHRPLVILISNEVFARFSSFLPWIFGALALYQLGDILGSFGVLYNRLRVYIIQKIISSVITAFSLFLFCNWFGPIGIVLGLTLAGLIYTPWCAIKTYRLVIN